MSLPEQCKGFFTGDLLIAKFETHHIGRTTFIFVSAFFKLQFIHVFLEECICGHGREKIKLFNMAGKLN